MFRLIDIILEGHFYSRTRLFYRLAAVFFLVWSAPSLIWATSWNFTINLDAPGTGVTPPQNCSGGNHPDIVTVTADSIYQTPQPLSTDLRVTWNTESRDACQGRNIPGGGYYYYVLYLINNGATPQAPTVPTDGQPPNAGPWQFFIHHVNSCCGENVGGIDDLGTIQNLAAQSGVTGPPYVLWIGGLVDGFYWNNPNSPGTPNPLSVPLHITDDGKAPNVVISPSSGTYSVSAPPAPTVTINDDNPVASSYTITYTGANLCGSAPQATGFFNGSTPLIYHPSLPSVCGVGTYALNILTVDAGNNTTISIATYTLVDLTPSGFTGTPTGDTSIFYSWTSTTSPIGRYELVLNNPDPAGSPAQITIATFPASVTSSTMNFANISPPFGAANWPLSNFYSSATLRGCLESVPPACSGPGISNVVRLYTLADPVPNTNSPVPFTSTATLTFSPGQNSLNPGNTFLEGTTYKLFFSSTGFPTPNVRVQNPAAGNLNPNGDVSFKLTGLSPNSPYNYYVDTYNGSLNGDLQAIQALPVPAPSVIPFWTFPAAPGVPFNSTTTATSITATFTFANNPSGTRYVLQASASNFTNLVDVIASQPVTQMQQVSGSTTSATITAAPGSTYFLRACALPNPLANGTTGPACSASAPLPVTTNIQAGSIGPNCPTTTSITASWNFQPQPSVASLVAAADDANGTPIASGTGAPGPSIPITVAPLTSNTFYTLILEHMDTNSGGGPPTGPFPYPGSDTPGYTYAATPGMPTLASTGTIANLAIDVSLSTDTNSTDSLYSVTITLPNGAGVVYLTPGNAMLASLTASAVSFPKSQWTAGPNQVSGVAANSTYAFQVVVQQRIPNTIQFIPPSQGCPPGGGTVNSGVVSLTTPGSMSLQSFSTPSGVLLDGVAWGVPQNAPIVATFNLPQGDPINQGTLPGNVTITQVTPPGAPLITCNAASPCWKLVAPNVLNITPPSGLWAADATYSVNLAGGITDSFGVPMNVSTSTYFVTVPPSGTTSSVVSPLDPSSLVTVGVPATAIVSGGGGFAVPRLAGTTSSALFFGSPSSLNISQQGGLSVKTAAEIDIFHCTTGCGPTNSDNPLTLAMTTKGATAGAFKGIDPATLGIYTLGSQGILSLMPGSTCSNGTCSAPVTQSGLYYLAGAIITQLNGAYAYPVPFKPALGHTVITFKNLAPATTIKIYTIMGELVRELDTDAAGDNVIWDVTNGDGENVASGVYVYQIKNSFSEQRGKLIIIR